METKEFTEERKRKAAVAIEYIPGSFAPKIVAKGKGVVAENILSKGKEHNIKTYQDKDLVKDLLNTDIGNYIPQELYYAVAQVLVFINELDKRKGAL
ncbi:MAG: EscU/YscU/HrcU family type III secretion system export apparatus switch protein [Defluviitaleaceae bacterium]|nr:EscU/YscU/HrcU family type III secretion system export apparatus switch protein [Defluviitaleaceae bacterium]